MFFAFLGCNLASDLYKYINLRVIGVILDKQPSNKQTLEKFRNRHFPRRNRALSARRLAKTFSLPLCLCAPTPENLPLSMIPSKHLGTRQSLPYQFHDRHNGFQQCKLTLEILGEIKVSLQRIDHRNFPFSSSVL